MFENEDNEDFFDANFHDEMKDYKSKLSNGERPFYDADQLDSFIDHFVMSNQLQTAMDCVNHAIELYETNLSFRIRKAQVLSNLGRLNEALAMLMQNEKLLGNDPEFLLTKASVHSQMRDSKSAIKYFERALKELDGEEKDEVYIDLSAEYQNLGNMKEAIQILKQAIVFNPNNEAAVHELAYCYDLDNKIDDAIKCYQDYLDIEPYSFTTWYNLGNAFSKAENYKDALWAYDYCLIINEEFTSAYFNMGNVYLVRDEYHKAIECFERCIAIDGEDALALDYIAEAYEHLEEYDLAIDYYKRSIALQPDLPDPWLGMGIALDQLNRTKEGLPYLKKAVSLDPLNADYNHVLGAAMIKADMKKEAKVVLMTAIEMNPLAGEILVDLTELKAETDLHQAYDDLNEHIEAYELSGRILLHRVKYAWLSGHQTDAVIFYREILIENKELAGLLLEFFPEAKEITQLMDLYKLT
jgi:tetratricopeptide (TPR) repeat protein